MRGPNLARSTTSTVARSAAASLAVLALAACTTDGSPAPSTSASSPPGTSSAAGIRQTDDAGRRLPFDTRFPERWNRGNNGTTYEPCTALNPAQLAEAGLDSASVRDVAVVSGQTARGCSWKVPGQSQVDVGQSVGNSESVAAHKEKQHLSQFLPDQVIDGRTVAVARDSIGACSTYVQSGRAGVYTISSVFTLPEPPIEQVCAPALRLLRATISQIPR